MENKSNYIIEHLALSHSSISSADRCMRVFEFSKLFGDGEDRDEQFAAECGKALHVGFQHFLTHKDEAKAVFAFLLVFPHDLEFTKPENSSRSLEACYATLMELMRSPICDQYELVYIKTRFGDTRPAIEVPFAIEIVNSPFPLPVYFIGFIDAILYNRHNNSYLVDDVKTTRIKIGDYSARYEFDEQTVPYAIILEHVLGQKIEELTVSYLSAYIDLMEPKVSMYTFTKTPDHIRDWYRSLCEKIGRMARYYKDEWWPRATNGSTCFSFNKPCWFNDYCSTRDAKVLRRMIQGKQRKGLFHDGQEPWFIAKLEWKE